MRKRLISLILAIMMITLISCENGDTENSEAANDGNNAENTVENSTEEAPVDYLEKLGEKNFNGAEFNIIAQHFEQRPNLSAGELTGEPLNDALYTRKINVEDNYNVVINEIGHEDRGLVRDTVKNSVLAEDYAYDLVMTSLAEGINTLMPDGCLYDLYSLPTLDLKQSWWSQNMNTNLTLNGKLYTTTGPISCYYYYMPAVIAFNTKLCEDYKTGNIYDMVRDGTWTVERMYTLMQGVTHDLDGNGKIDANDFYALLVDDESGRAFFVGCGGTLAEKSSDGSYYLDLASDKNMQILDLMRSYFGDRNSSLYYESINSSNINIFTESRALFASVSIVDILADFRSMEADYGIVPMPKYNESQKDYITYGQPWGPGGVAVPITCQNAEMTGFLMEAMAYISNELVRPALYDVTLKNKVARDSDSQYMLDLIFSDIYFDINSIYDFGGTGSLLRQYAIGAKDNFVSTYASLEKAAKIGIQKVLDAAK